MNRETAMNTALTALGLAAAAGLVMLSMPQSADASPGSSSTSGPGGLETVDEAVDPNERLPEAITLTGIVRDFRERSLENGHTDFEKQPDEGFGHYMGNVAPQLGEDSKPVFTGSGKRVNSQWRDSDGNNIHPSFYDPEMGDQTGSFGVDSTGGIASADSFRSWYRDSPGKNVSLPMDITLRKVEGSNLYVFDDREDDFFQDRGGFFPINAELFGNSSGDSKNFHFTFELATEFTYKAGEGQSFTFTGDDDVWVFINGQLVIDIGGVHSKVSQTVHLDRLGLNDGKKYPLTFFFAERHRTQSNFRIETTLSLRNAELPSAMAMFD